MSQWFSSSIVTNCSMVPFLVVIYMEWGNEEFFFKKKTTRKRQINVSKHETERTKYIPTFNCRFCRYYKLKLWGHSGSVYEQRDTIWFCFHFKISHEWNILNFSFEHFEQFQTIKRFENVRQIPIEEMKPMWKFIFDGTFYQTLFTERFFFRLFFL